MGSDLEQWKRCLVKSIQLFCKNYCQYDQEAKIDGILAITLDKKEVILVKLQEVDSDSSALRTTAKPTLEQSEQLESILRYLAPSCRLLKKAAVVPQLPTVWKPVGESLATTTSSSETPDRLTFLRSLGLAPTAVVESQLAARSACPIRLRSKSNLNVHTSSMPDPDVRLNNSNARSVVESLKVVGASSQMPSASPRPGHVALPTAASCDGQQSSSERFLTVSTHKPREGILELIARESQLKNMKPLSIVCDKNGTNSVLQQQQQQDAKVVIATTQSASAMPQNNTNSVSNEQRSTGRIKKPTAHSVVHRRHIGTCSGCHGADAKPSQHPHRPKKRVNTETSSSTGSNKSTKSTHGAPVKRIKSEPKDKDDSAVDVKPPKIEGGSLSSDHPTTKTAVCKKFTKLKDRTTVVSKLKSSTTTNTSDSSAANAICKRKTAVVDLKPLNRKRMNLTSAKKENSVPGKHLMNKSKARLKVLYSKAANSRKERVLKALRRVRAKGCGSCSACKVKENCRTCNFCLDMKCYGGPNKLHKKCRLRQCRFIKSSCNAVSSGATEDDPDDSK